MKTRVILLAIAALLYCVAAEYTAKDMHSLARLGNFAVSPKGVLVYTVSQWSSVTNQTTSSLYATGSLPLTQPGQYRDSSPAFNPKDGNTVFFLSNRIGANNVWYTSVTSIGSATQLTNYPLSISNVKVTPNYLMFTAEVYDVCGTDFVCTVEKDTWLEENPNHGMAFDNLFVRHWDKIVVPGKTSQLFTQQIVQNAGGVYSLVGNVVQVTANAPAMNVPVPPDGGIEQLDISPDFSRIAFTGDLVRHSTAWSTGWRIYEVRVDPSTGIPNTQVNCLSCAEFVARTTFPRYDPTGKFLAFLAMDRADFEADRLHLEVMRVGFEGNQPLAYNFDRSIVEFVWTSDGNTILAAADEDGEHRVFSVNVKMGIVNTVLTDGTNGALLMTPNNVLYFSHSAFNAPADINSVVWNPGVGRTNGAPVRETTLNPSFPTSIFDPGTKFYFPSEDGSQVQGWLFKPVGWSPDWNYPFVLLIHGGPQGAWNSGWSYRWNPQLWAQRGYVVAMINPHGSTGFGQAFCDAVSGNWGGIPFRDLMTGVDVLLKNYTWIDNRRTSACGASYGGFMINWIQGNANRRFSSLVVHDGLYDIPISYGATDELWFPEWEFKGLPWENPQGYQKYNPANYADKWITPMLVVHGGLDYRVDLAHGLAAFTTLQRRGLPSRFLYFPKENHWVSKPTNSIQWYSEVLGWLDTYTKNAH
jgi:dipeptidyl aminopeptidase/acylaminoacyl peptidase